MTLRGRAALVTGVSRCAGVGFSKGGFRRWGRIAGGGDPDAQRADAP